VHFSRYLTIFNKKHRFRTMQKVPFAIFWLILFSPDLWAAEKLLYAIRHESFQRYPDIVNTKIFSLDPERSKSRLIFSDEKAGVMLLPKRGMPGHPGDALICSKNRIFAHAVEKRFNPGRWYPYKASIFELSTDGSNKFREILNVIGEQSLAEIFVDSAGTKIGYINYLNQKTFIFIHETEAGKLLHKIDLSKVFLDCFASIVGWLPDGNRLFFTLDTGDVHMTSEDSYKQRGTYLINEDGTGLVKLSEGLTLYPLGKGFWRATDSPPRLMGGLPDGTYIFRDAKSRGYREILSFIYKVNPINKSQKEIPLKISEGLNWFKVSPTGQYMAFTEKISSKKGLFEWVEYIWIKDLASGEENRVFILDNTPFKGHYLGLVGWIGN